MTRIKPIKPVATAKNSIRTKRNSAIAAVIIVAMSLATISFTLKWLSGASDYLVVATGAAAGTPLAQLETRAISLNLGEAGKHYLKASAALGHLTLARPLQAGDLLLKSDLEPTDKAKEMMRLVVAPKNALPSNLEVGQKVDLWSAVNDGGGQFGEPEPIATGVQVASVSNGTGLFAEASNRVELAVIASDVAPILSAVLHSDALSVVAHVRPE